MPTYCANLTWLFTELPMRERVAAAARAGFEAVEVLWPYDIPADELAMLLVERLAVIGVLAAPDLLPTTQA